MKILLILLSLFCCFFLNAQISQQDQLKIQKIIGKDFQLLPVQKKYPYTSVHTGCQSEMSTTISGDTVGIHFNNEYLLFRHPIAYKKGQEVLKLMKPGYVTVKEYLDFQQYVRDSIAMEKIYHGIEYDQAADRLLDLSNLQGNQNKHDPSNREKNRSLTNSSNNPYHFNKKYKVSYSAYDIAPLLTDMYLPQPERLNKQRVFDERKLHYSFHDVYERLNTMPEDSVAFIFPFLAKYWEAHGRNHKILTITSSLIDSYTWAQKSSYNKDEFSVLAQVYNKLLINEPIIGLTGMQVNAFCHWKQEEIQKQLNQQKIDYKAVVTTPLWEDLPAENSTREMVVPAHNYTAQWKITYAEYQKFIDFTHDSILREKLFYTIENHEEALKLLKCNKKKTYFSEGIDEWIPVDPANRPAIRQQFPFNYQKKIRSMNADELSNPSNNIFTYSYVDAYQRSIPGIFKENGLNNGTPDFPAFLLDPTEPYSHGKDLILDVVNLLYQSSGVRSHENFQMFIITESIPVLPQSEIKNRNPKSLIQEISYEQAMAFYHWKYPIHKLKSSDEWQQFVMPSEEQFLKIKRGESIVIPERKVAYPTPVFRYVVHFYPQ